MLIRKNWGSNTRTTNKKICSWGKAWWEIIFISCWWPLQSWASLGNWSYLKSKGKSFWINMILEMNISSFLDLLVWIVAWMTWVKLCCTILESQDFQEALMDSPMFNWNPWVKMCWIGFWIASEVPQTCSVDLYSWFSSRVFLQLNPYWE